MGVSKIRHGLKEIAWIRTSKDAEGYFRKTAYLLPRIFGLQYRHTRVPASLQLEPTNFCNLHCICCPVSRSSRPRGFMNFDLFRKIIDDASGTGVKRIHLYLHGEPLLHPRLFEMIRYLKSKKLFFNLVTNGTLFDEAMFRSLLNAGIDMGDHVIFSVLGCSREVHEKIMKGVRHAMVCANISDLMEMRRKHGMHAPVVEVVFYAMPENVKEKNLFAETWNTKVDHVRIVARISKSFRDYKRSTGPIPLKRDRCPNIWERMTVCWNGDVILCCEDVDGEYVTGNLAGCSIQAVWNCEEFLALKQIHKKKEYYKHPLCRVCDMAKEKG